MKQSFKRRRLLVDPGFQLRLLARMGGYFLFYAVFVWHIGFLVKLLGAFAGNELQEGIGELYADYFWQQRSLLYALGLTMPIFLGDMMKFSHRVAGPLFRCRRVMDEMAEGKTVPEFTPRKHDLMRDFFTSFNALIKKWNARQEIENIESTPVQSIVDKNKLETVSN